MRAGRLDRKITIQRRYVTQNEFGEEVVEWQNICPPVWAEKESGQGIERYVASQYVGKSVLVFRIRYSSDVKEVTTKHRVIFEGRVHDILNKREIGRREGLWLDCEVRSEELDTA